MAYVILLFVDPFVKLRLNSVFRKKVLCQEDHVEQGPLKANSSIQINVVEGAAEELRDKMFHKRPVTT
ncbi:hypothetical protein GCK72_017983 [Caenorhabditis remanei]|uniref:Uncharacterized protein n=1 Tax=Caenorhabditis remanei TaxID=31234 RepID=A0A6A5GAC5_CAERE|nr:hypothetical protein GCK72_017983 [Caenorhabditis remanei]KAF1751429.1 hypothetical protein GCK72_017983 [Caenorhabditis remanei]